MLDEIDREVYLWNPQPNKTEKKKSWPAFIDRYGHLRPGTYDITSETYADNVEKFESAVAKKNQMYNSKEGTPRYFTFRILTGQNSNQYLRAQYITSPEELDEVDTVGNAYWQKTVGQYHTSEGGRVWGRSNNTSYYPEDNERVTLRRIIYYKYKDSHEDDFWRFRWRW